MAADNFILFEIDGAAYAVRTDQVEMVEMVDSITRVPNAPDFVEGVTAVRGQVVPVISVRRRFQMEPIAMDLRTRLVITRFENRFVGMLVDTAREFARISPEQIKSPDSLAGKGADYLEGIATLPDRLVLLINLERLLSFEEHEALSEQGSYESETNSPPADVSRGSPNASGRARKSSRGSSSSHGSKSSR